MAGFPLHTLVIDCVSHTLTRSVSAGEQFLGCGGLYDVVFACMDRKGGVVARGHSVREFKCVRAVVP